MLPAVDHELERGLLQLDHAGAAPRPGSAGQVGVLGLVVGALEHQVRPGPGPGWRCTRRSAPGASPRSSRHPVPELISTGPVGALERVDRAERRVDLGLAPRAPSPPPPPPPPSAPPQAAATEARNQQTRSWHGARSSTDGQRHPFTAPAVSPRTRWRWNSDQDHGDRDGGDHGSGHHQVELVDVGRREALEPDLHRPVLRSSVTSRGQRYWFQASRNEKTVRRGDGRPGQRHGDVPQEAPVAVAVEGGGVPEVLRDARGTPGG